ncbi:MAG: hypothetical protein JNK88_01755, partial [Mangrovicoccus sp.]|nr:hypothetical protein [Mangrovicoccus sp.]
TASGLTTGLDRDAALALPDTAATQSGLSAGAIRGRVGADGRLARLEAGKTCG